MIACSYFGTCGGCQFYNQPDYQDWKRSLVYDAVQGAGLATEVLPLINAHGAGRRRATFHIRFERGTPVIGYMQARSHTLVPIATCPVLEPGLERVTHMLAHLVQPLSRLNKPVDCAVTLSETGIDADLRGTGPLPQALSIHLIERAGEVDLARLSLHGAVLVEYKKPVLTVGQSLVVLPPNSFLQATAAGEAAIAACILDACQGARKIADLFCGIGPWTLRLAQTAQVEALDCDEAAITALQNAARLSKGLKPIWGEKQDLFRRPKLDFTSFDAVVMNPPRAGAEAQVRQLARSRVKTLVYVSCNPQTFARDALHLCKAGYSLETVTPIDQFLYSRHVECVGVFRLGEISG